MSGREKEGRAIKFSPILALILIVVSSMAVASLPSTERTKTLVIGFRVDAPRLPSIHPGGRYYRGIGMVKDAGGKIISNITEWLSVTVIFPQPKAFEILRAWEDKPNIRYVELKSSQETREVLIGFVGDDVDNEDNELIRDTGGEIKSTCPEGDIVAEFPRDKVEMVVATWDEKPQVEYVEFND